MTASWVELMAALRDDDELAAVVVTGAPPAFSAGGDLSWIVAEPDAPVSDLRARMLAFYRSWLSVRELEVPTIAAVNGAAVGRRLRARARLRPAVCRADARLGVPFTSLGLHPGMATTWSLPQVAGSAVARDLLLTGRVVTAPRRPSARPGVAGRARPTRCSTRRSRRPSGSPPRRPWRPG